MSKNFHYVNLPSSPFKIFGIGLCRTSTSSLSYALMQLGFKTWHAPAILDQNNFSNIVNKFDTLTDLWSVTSISYLDLYKSYPNAKYILTIRDTDAWSNSVKYYKKSF